MFNLIKNQRGEGTIEAIGGLFVFLIFVGIIWAILGALLGGESDGSVKYDDCRQVISVKQDDWQNNFKKFTCENIKSNSGRLISGTCVHIDTSGGACITAYVYTKKSGFNCGDNSTPNVDDSVYACSCNDGYHVDPKDNKKPCIVDSPTLDPAQNTTDPNPLMVSPTPTNNNDVIVAQKELEPVIKTSNNPNLIVKVSKLIGNYATGTVGTNYSGSAWFAVKIDGQWNEVWTGQNIISCKPVQQYNIPKEIYGGECSNNY